MIAPIRAAAAPNAPKKDMISALIELDNKLCEERAGLLLNACTLAARGKLQPGASGCFTIAAIMKAANKAEGAAPAPPSFFDPDFISQFGGLCSCSGGVFKEMEMGVKQPLDAGALVALLRDLKSEKADPLNSFAFRGISSTLPPKTVASLQLAVHKRWLAYDHVVPVVREAGLVVAIYVARGRPDMWKPETKKDHRRKILPGVWVSRQPVDSSDEEFWAARRAIGLVHGITPARSSISGRDEVLAHFFADERAALRGGDKDERAPLEGVGRQKISELKVLNQHLGKAGGLNFGIEAILHSKIVPAPSKTHPYVFGIVDARHSSDSRWWKLILPQFFELKEIDDQVAFDPARVLCQVPHSYIGATQRTDKLDVSNNFFFSGMALFRDRSCGMTSCGTGGVWTITSSENLGDYFFGRTMIEDTTSTHKYFLRGFQSRYLPPLRGQPQLMRAVPKVSANYLEALERWDTGAVQSLLTQGVPACWFWFTLLFFVGFFAAITAPVWTFTYDPLIVIADPWSARHIFPSVLYIYSFLFFVIVFGGIFYLALMKDQRLNWLLRFVIIFFNTTYPFTSIVGFYWLLIPPYAAIRGFFPFSLNAQYALIGSIILKLIEMGVVSRLQASSASLDEHSIAAVQRLDKVTTPIKIRAIIAGFETAYKDRYYLHDNSWWVSFGTSGAILWVRRWLVFLTSVAIATIVAGTVNIVVHTVQGTIIQTVVPLGFAIIMGFSQIYTVWEPMMFVWKGDSVLNIAPRFVELAVTITMLVTVFLILELVTNGSGPLQIPGYELQR